MSDKKYPYIGISRESGNVVLFFDKDSGERIEGSTCSTGMTGHWNECVFTNITAECLANTYGEVKDARHAEFIKALAEANDIDIEDVSVWCDGEFFNFYADTEGYLLLDFFAEETAKDSDEKQITIPQPPEGWGVEEDKQEWPKVGDDAEMRDGSKCVVRCIVGDLAWCECPGSSIAMITVHLSNLKKPKTPEQELQEDIYSIILNGSAGFATKTLLEKYNITKKDK